MNQVGKELSNERKVESGQDFWWLIGCFAVIVIAVFLRFYQLETRPLHHDEGVNGFFLTTLFKHGVYHYEPSNYHGPTLYYIALAFSKIFGLSTISIRASMAVFGVLTVALAFFLKNYIGKIGSLVAALFLALSPGMVFISRYFIHEIFFIFLSFGLVVAVVHFIEKRKAGPLATATMALLLLMFFLPLGFATANLVGQTNTNLLWVLRLVLSTAVVALVLVFMRFLLRWQSGRSIYLLLSSASIALLFATKETAFITIGVLLLACVCVWLWRRIYRISTKEIIKNELEPVQLSWANFRAQLGNSNDRFFTTAAISVVFAYCSVLLFSSFFTYSEGIAGAFKTYAFWTKTGSKDHMQNGFWAYLQWGWKIESPILLLSAFGTLIALKNARHRFALFTSFWAMGMFAAYTLIPYKTPWLALSFLLPMCVVAGYGINGLLTSGRIAFKILGATLATGGALVLGYQSYDLNFLRYDKDSMPYVYAHTERGFSGLIERIEYYAEKSGEGKGAATEIISPEYWPMPWYLREYPKAIFHGKFADAKTSEMIVASSFQVAELDARYGTNYKLADAFPLRPGIELYLLVRRDLADANAKEIRSIFYQQQP